MKISVVIPCYNAAPWIGAALRSAAAQTLAPHEILVVDDGSTDGSLEAITASGVEVRLLRTARRGGAGARNEGIRAATGDWIAFLDADDVWYADHLERARALLRDEVAYLAHYDHLGLDGSFAQQEPFWPIEQPTNGLDERDFLRLFLGNQFFPSGALVVRRDHLLDIGLFDESQVRRHDLELWLRIVAGRRWCFDPVAAYGYRVDTPGSLSKNLASRERWFLLALLKNRDALRGPEMERLIRLGARRAMSHAHLHGDASDRREAAALAMEHLAPRDLAVFRAAALCPPLFAFLNRTRQRFGGPMAPP
ncbi:glycosyltransferase family 2 protein [Vulgatibacter sp.]|uniref:glycosyltransferase family 2 protein n=1 Tax=Vulgatibacter sp. TaxID=1971226 RepID=UPI00356974E3